MLQIWTPQLITAVAGRLSKYDTAGRNLLRLRGSPSPAQRVHAEARRASPPNLVNIARGCRRPVAVRRCPPRPIASRRRQRQIFSSRVAARREIRRFLPVVSRCTGRPRSGAGPEASRTGGVGPEATTENIYRMSGPAQHRHVADTLNM